MVACISIIGILCSAYRVWYLYIIGIFFVVYANINLIKSKKIIKAAVWITVFAVAFIFSFFNYHNSLCKRTKYLTNISDNEYVYVSGEVYKCENKNDSYVYYIKSQTGFNVIAYSDSKILRIGDISKLKGKVNTFKRERNEGGFDAQSFYWSQNIIFSINVEKLVTRRSAKLGISEYLYKIKDEMIDVLLSLTKEEEGSTLTSILFGEKKLLTKETKEAYKYSGFSHVLAISGLHISILGMGLYRLLRRMRVGLCKAALFSVALSYAYCIMTGNSVSTRRAFVMFTLIVIANIIGRAGDMLNSLGIVICFMLFENPFIIFYSGFLFSVISIIGVAVLLKEIKEKKIKGLIYSSIVMQLVTIPLVAYYNYEIPIYATFVNAILLPLFSILITCGMIGCLFSYFSIGIAKLIIAPAIYILKFYSLVCGYISDMSFNSIVLGRPHIGVIIVFYILLILIIKLRKIKIPTRIIGIILLICMLFFRCNTYSELSVLDVGQGDGIYIHTVNGMNFFVDGGSTSVKKVGKNIIIPFLKCKGIRQIDGWFITHADEDHINGLVEVIEYGYKIKRLIVARAASTDEKLCELIDLARKKAIDIIQISQGDSFEFGDDKIICLYPSENENIEDRNDLSLVLLYKTKSYNAMLSGDISAKVENRLCEKYKDTLNIEIYKVNHHGSKNSNDSRWLDMLSPQLSVVSCGKKNRYGHPAPDAIRRIEESGSDVLYTMNSGQIMVREGRIIKYIDD